MVGTVGSSQHHGAGAVPDAVDAPLIPRTYYDAREAGELKQRNYCQCFERKVRKFVFGQLQSESGSALPNEMKITVADVGKIEAIYTEFYDIWDVFTQHHKEEFALDALASTLIEDMTFFDDMYDALTKNDLCSQSHALRKVINDINCSLRGFYHNRKLFQAFDTVLADLSAGHKSDALGDLTSLVTASTRRGGLPLFPELLELLLQIKLFSEGKIVREALAQTDEQMYTIYAVRLRECFFKGDEGIGDEGYQAFKTLFSFYQKHFDYYNELLALKYHYAEAYFDNFMHKGIQVIIEDRLQDKAQITQAEYKQFKSYVQEACMTLYRKAAVNKEEHSLTKLRDLFLGVHAAFEDSPLEEIQIAQQMKIDPRSELLRDSYVRLFERLYDLRTRYLGERWPQKHST